mmetsp:Transcript_33446/g.40073  ORF Transcript_33446/g.40073 Transcript_33446/m.40073 type:complete len:147 (-) Transcript_33446:405-845(-)|eukprot:CAMPEP_0198248666 /NCGR_PEP_ID=MMETSP1447-20131203/396_1 /TAXON_ID=420782 /ORGANISM="Chaetoceros dichaeta, Strain CCMP1751" /LENGTH=146 /DNA_ID=CAMNT_0043933131 /DNA_START=33 /DNA_END=473 /DNA_ORIENTATION=+
MKLSVIAILGTVGSTLAFAPASITDRTTVATNAEVPSQSRKAFFGTVAASVLASVPVVANAGTMSQELVLDKTEQWETGSPTAAAKVARNERFKNARNQNTSNFAPIKRLTLERKSPVERLDINAPNFSVYKKTYPGLYKKADGSA